MSMFIMFISLHFYITGDQTKNILICTLCQMLQMAQQEDGSRISVVLLRDHMLSNIKEHTSIETDDGTSTCCTSGRFYFILKSVHLYILGAGATT